MWKTIRDKLLWTYLSASYRNESVKSIFFSFIIPFAQQSCWGVYWFHSVRPSVHPSVPHPVSALWHLHFWLDPFHIYTSYQVTSEGVPRVKLLAKFQNLNFWQFFQICNFDFVLFWLGIWCESLVWVIMGQRRVSQNASILIVLGDAIWYHRIWSKLVQMIAWINDVLSSKEFSDLHQRTISQEALMISIHK